MKALIKGGLCLALGWLANDAAAQDEVRWQAFTPKNNSPIAVLSPSVNANTSRPAVIPLDTAIRPVSLTETVPLESNTDYGTKTGSGRVVLGSSLPMVVRGQVVRGQAGDNSVIPPLPTVGGTKEVIPIPPPRTMPNDDRGFIAPQPAPYSIIPMPADSVWNSMSAPGEGPSTGLNEGCCSPKLGSMFGGNGGCCPDRSRFWMSGEYLMWWQRSDSVPPLVTTSPLPFVDGQSGVLGGPNTQILYNSFPNHTRGGARFDAGMWLDRSSNWGVEANFLFLGREDDIATFSSNGNPLLFRPFYSVNPLTGTVTPAVEDVANPFAKVVPVVGSVTVDHFSQLWGIEGNVRYKWRCGSNYWIDILAGYRHLNLSEGVDITENLTPTDGNPLAPRIVQDSFHTRNQFNGAQVGLDSEWRWNRFFLGATGKLAMGSTYEILNIDGSTTFFTPNAVTQQGGLYALPTNIGRYTSSRFAVLPEVGLKLGYDITNNLRVFVGYNVIYLSNVIRPGEQINQAVNVTYQPNVAGPGTQIGPRQPSVLFRTSDYWAQGLNFGLLYRF